MITWGISANSHDGALAVFEDNELIFASHTERFSGIKNDPYLNHKIIRYARRIAGEPDMVCWYENPLLKFTRQVYAGQEIINNWKEANIRNVLSEYDIKAPIFVSKHHESHAAAAFYTSPFDTCAVLCIDGIGEWTTTSIWQANTKDGLKKVWSYNYPNSLGLWYTAMTQRVGLNPNEDEYILMGMAAYGDPNRLKARIEEDFFEYMIPLNGFRLKQNLHRGCLRWAPELTTEQDMYDIAAATQSIYEDKFKGLLYKAVSLTGSKNVSLAGGCALNCVANITARDIFDKVWIYPNPSDAGSSIGAVLAQTKKKLAWEDCYLGYSIPGEYPVEETLEVLLTGHPVGVANGPSEFGPRALGNRSLLADPRSDTVKDRVNEIKRRQKFRPFAPAILEEFANDYFDLGGQTSRFMQYAVKCKRPNELPGVVHADGTSRVQTVPNNGSGFRQLLEAWYRETGCPVLLNTSLNIKGQPIVNDTIDADAFEKRYNVPVFTHRL
jgi:carbamoyltransferase